MLFIESCRWLCLAFFGGGYDKLVIVSLQLWKISLTIAFPRETPPPFWNQSRCFHDLLPSSLLYKIRVKSVLLGVFIRVVIWKERAAVDFRQRSLETCVVTGVDFVEPGSFLPPRHWLWRLNLRLEGRIWLSFVSQPQQAASWKVFLSAWQDTPVKDHCLK